jgi:glycosyltransferase involved in cell wall biosynthesis
MRILHATDLYPPVFGGLELQLQQLAEELARRGHEVEVVTLAGASSEASEREATVPVHRIKGWTQALGQIYANPSRPFHPTVPDPGVVLALARLIRQSQPEVVHAHSWILYSLLPLLPTSQTRLVVGLHDFGLVCPKKTFVYRGGQCTGPRYAKCVGCATEQYGHVRALALTTGLAAMRPLRGRVDQIVANSAAVARVCESLLPPKRPPIEIIPPFLSREAVSELQGPRPAFVPASGDYLLFAGGPEPHKGLPILLEAWAGLSPQIPLVVAGLQRGNTPYPIPDRVRVAGYVPHADVLRAWAHCLVAVVPSCWPEPFGLVALEAMAAGRPVVASKVGNLSELVVDGTTGFLVPARDPQALRAAIQRLLSSPELRERMGAAARERAAYFSADSVVPRLERVYRDVVAEHASTAGRTDRPDKPVNHD